MDFNKIEHLISKKNYQQALAEIQSVLAKSSNLDSSMIVKISKYFREMKAYGELVNIYEEWKKRNITMDNWDCKHYANALRNCEKYDEALNVCEIVKQKDPSFEPIEVEYYNSYFHCKIKKWYIHEVDTLLLIAFAEEVKNKYLSVKKKEFWINLYNKVIMYTIENLHHIQNYEECEKWALLLNANQLSTESSFTKNGKEIHYTPQKAKYYSIFSDVLLATGKIDMVEPLILSALEKYKHWTHMYEKLFEVMVEKYNTKGLALFELLLGKIGFKENMIKKNYLRALLGTGLMKCVDEWNKWSERKDIKVNSYSNWERIWINRVGKMIINFLKEIDLKEKLHSFPNNLSLNYSIINAGEFSNFVFCPVAFSINATFDMEVRNANTGKIEIDWEDKKMLIERIETYKETSNLQSAFTDEEHLVGIPQKVYEIIQAKIIEENKKNENPTIHSNSSRTFRGVPDYLFRDNKDEQFVVEEVFMDHSGEKINLEEAYANHVAKVSAFLFELETLHAQKGYIIYWIGGIGIKEYQTNMGTQQKSAYMLKGIKVFEILKNQENKEKYQGYLEKLRNFVIDKKIEFPHSQINPNKCANCSVSEYCFHKTGALLKLALPYNTK